MILFGSSYLKIAHGQINPIYTFLMTYHLDPPTDADPLRPSGCFDLPRDLAFGQLLNLCSWILTVVFAFGDNYPYIKEKLGFYNLNL